ncbi:MAG: hypothetical protein K8T26_11960 [Lentisphaerae bacterium]|nr:hypothetical protein [Lentisphaerota bacterium]
MKSSQIPTCRRFTWLVLGAALAVLFGVELLIPGRSLFRWDTLLYTLPVIQDARAQILSGHWPFWSSSVCSGTPLLANINAGVLYPLRVMCWFLPLRPGLHLFVFAHVVLSLAGMYLLVRRGLRRSTAAAAVGALSYAACGYARGMWDTYNIVAMPWIPLGLAALLFAGRDASPRSRMAILGAAACWWMMLVGGDFQAAVLWVPVAFLLAILHPRRRRMLPALAVALVMGGLLAAPQWVPTAYAEADSYRAGGMPWTEAIERSLHPARFLELLVPYLFGPRGAWLGDALAAPQADHALPWTASIHIGRLAFGLVWLSLVRRARPVLRWSLLLSLGAALLSMGGFLPGFRCWLQLPILGGFRYPEKYILWLSLGLAVLAAYGTSMLLACARAGRWRDLGRLTRGWLTVLAGGTALSTAVLCGLAMPASEGWSWSRVFWAELLLLVVLTLAGLRNLRGASPRVAAGIVVALVVIDAGMAWFIEIPTTSHFDPLTTPLVAQTIRQSGAREGRVLHDPASVAAPSEVDLSALSVDERRVLLSRSLLDFNSPVLWGLRTAGGFSPLESATMRAYRDRAVTPPGGASPDAKPLIAFCRDTAVEWLLTTGTRSTEFLALGLDAEPASTWGPSGALTLLHLRHVQEAVCVSLHERHHEDAETSPRTARVHRFRPGYFRVDVTAGDPCELLVRETWAPGWSACDQGGGRLAISPTRVGLMCVALPADTTQVRFQYTPAGWRAGLWLALAGVLLAGLVCGSTAVRASATWRSPLVSASACILVALSLGLGARAHWACTFDEGFHVARGVAALRTGDTRLSYFHPPLQNLASAYFANLAFGERLTIPTRDPGWKQADIWSFSCAFADANRTFYPDLIRSARSGSAAFLALLIGTCVWWAHRWRGPTAAWIAGLGLALNPALLAHGNLATTDMGVTAFAMLGTALLWRAMQAPDARSLGWATLSFAAAAATKHSGLIWWLSYLVIVIPMVAWTRRSWRPLAQLPLGIASLAALLLGLYGFEPQVIRGPVDGWLTGVAMPAGRFVEGLIAQEQHSLAGHRAYFHGMQLLRAPWWYMPVALVLKSPPVWVLAALLACVASWRHVRLQRAIPWIPFGVLLLLLVFANRLAIGVRHALPVVTVGILAAALWVASLPARRWRHGVAAGLVLASIAATACYPHFISYYPAWAGGVSGGSRWMVDSNYDWGQDIEELEAHWAAVTAANRGHSPHLLYFGFVDPVTIYGMPVAEPSLRGFMGRTRHWQAGAADHAAWVAALSQISGVTVASISALLVEPYGADFKALRAVPESGIIGHTFRIRVPTDVRHGSARLMPGQGVEPESNGNDDARQRYRAGDGR